MNRAIVFAFYFIIAFVFLSAACDKNPTKGDLSPDTTPPEVSILYPSNHSLVKGVVTVLVKAHDDVGIDRVELWVDSLKHSTSKVVTDTVAFDWDTRAYKNYSDHRLQAVAFDLSEYRASDTLDVIINNTYHIVVPTDIATISDAIDMATNGDTIIVFPGLYNENINFSGKNIVVGSLMMITDDTSYISTTIIDGSQNGSVVRFTNGESANAGLVGFTIRNGVAGYGGGIYCAGADPTLKYLKIVDNSAQYYGGGVYFGGSSSHLLNSWVLNNTSTDYNNHGGGIAASHANISLSDVIVQDNQAYNGGGLALYSSTVNMKRVQVTHNTGFHGGGFHLCGTTGIFRNVLIVNNSADLGGGINIQCMVEPSPRFENVTISRNRTNTYGAGGVYLLDNSQVHFINSIIWGNYPTDSDGNILFIKEDRGELIFEYCDAGNIIGLNGWVNNQAGTWLDGNIRTDPLFVSPDEGNFRLKEDSPGIDSGHPGTEYHDVDGSRNDMGAYGGPHSIW